MTTDRGSAQTAMAGSVQRSSMPAERDCFVGREAELDDLVGRLAKGQRLVTVLGFGGTGKTRLATHLAWRERERWPGGIWFIDLSDTKSEAGILAAAARVLDVPLAGKDNASQLGHAIAARGRCLLIVDNFEQVVDHARSTVGIWLGSAPEAQFLVTSRTLLGLPGEAAMTLDVLSREAAIALFVERAKAANDEIAIASDGLEAVGALVDLLDRLPLCIELAAARARLMTADKMLERMGDRFKLIAGPLGGRPDRHATLVLTLDWSWDLLSTEEGAALAQLSVFEGGFTLEAAEAVLEATDTWPADLIQSLVDKSLVRNTSEGRFGLLVSVQEYAAERLTRVERQRAEIAHGAFFARLGSEEAIDLLDRPGSSNLLALRAIELDNLVAAQRRAMSREDAACTMATLRAAESISLTMNDFRFQSNLLLAVLQSPGLATEHRVEATYAQSVLEHRLGDVSAALRGLELASNLATAAQSPRNLTVKIQATLASVLCRNSQGERAAAITDPWALTLHAEVDVPTRLTMLSALSDLRVLQGRYAEARLLGEEWLELQRSVGRTRGEALALECLGRLHIKTGAIERAAEMFQMAAACHRSVGQRRSKFRTLNELADCYRMQGRLVEAKTLFEEVAHGSSNNGLRVDQAWAHLNLGAIELDLDHPAAAEAHDCTARQIGIEARDRNLEANSRSELGRLYVHLGRLGEACTEINQATTLLASDPFNLGIALCTRALLEIAEHGLPAARQSIDEAEGIAVRIGAGPASELGLAVRRARDKLAAASDHPDHG